MKIRKAIIKDIPKIDEIYIEGSVDEMKLQFPKYSEKKFMKEIIKNQNSRKQGFRRYIKNKKFYWVVAEDNKEIIGFGQAGVKNKETGIIENVYVNRKFRKRGVGKAIMKCLIRWLKVKKVKNIISSLYINNKPSFKLHEKLKFKPFIIKMKLGVAT